MVLTAWSTATGAKGDGVTVIVAVAGSVSASAVGERVTVIVAVAVLDVPLALASVNWKLAVPLNPVVGVKVTVVPGNPLTVPPMGVPARAAEVGLPLAP